MLRQLIWQIHDICCEPCHAAAVFQRRVRVSRRRQMVQNRVPPSAQVKKQEPTMGEPSDKPSQQLNVLGLPIELCCQDPVTGFFRDGHCHTGPLDHGMHTVCALMTEEFLTFSVAAGNDLVTPMPQYGFPGLKGGDRWCLCAMRWHQAHEAGHAPRLYLRSTHQRTLQVVPLDVLKQFALDLS